MILRILTLVSLATASAHCFAASSAAADVKSLAAASAAHASAAATPAAAEKDAKAAHMLHTWDSFWPERIIDIQSELRAAGKAIYDNAIQASLVGERTYTALTTAATNMLPDLNRIIASYCNATLEEVLKMALSTPCAINSGTYNPTAVISCYNQECGQLVAEALTKNGPEFQAWRIFNRTNGLTCSHSQADLAQWTENSGGFARHPWLVRRDRMVCDTCKVEVFPFPFIECTPWHPTTNSNARTFYHPADWHNFETHIAKNGGQPDILTQRLQPQSVQAQPYAHHMPVAFAKDGTLRPEYKVHVLRHLCVYVHNLCKQHTIYQPDGNIDDAATQVLRNTLNDTQKEMVQLAQCWLKFYQAIAQVSGWQHFAQWILLGPKGYLKWSVQQLDLTRPGYQKLYNQVFGKK